ncbi:Glycine cleavage system transcriptional activator [compost metagenome]
MAALEDLPGHALLHRSSDQNDWQVWLSANGGKALQDYRHIPFNLDELALDAAARGLGVAMTDMTLAGESIQRGELVIPFGEPLKTRGIYSLCLQPSAASHPACAPVMQWFTAQTTA